MPRGNGLAVRPNFKIRARARKLRVRSKWGTPGRSRLDGLWNHPAFGARCRTLPPFPHGAAVPEALAGGAGAPGALRGDRATGPAPRIGDVGVTDPSNVELGMGGAGTANPCLQSAP